MPNSTNQYSIDPARPEPPPIPKVTAPNLSQLVPKTYSTVRARVIIIKSKQKQDELGDRNYIFGICEDRTFRTPFICYKPYPSFFQDGVFDFQDAYVHEFEDGSLLLIITERSSITYLPDEAPAEFAETYDAGKYCELLLDVAESILGVFQFSRTQLGFQRKTRNFLDELRSETTKEILLGLGTLEP